jgi:predicted nucleic acid-binding protein
MPERIKIHEINKLAGRTVFFDANVYLYIFWPTGNTRNEALYSRLYKECIQQKIPIAIDFTVLSEIINRTSRIEYNNYLNANNLTAVRLPFKNYRDSPDGRQTQSDIYEIGKKSLVSFTVYGKEYSKADLLSFMTVDDLDFNDKGIVSLCADRKFVLATNDKDFSQQDIPIISANPNIS